MKIGIVTIALSHGGAERVAVTLANGFSQRSHQVIIFTDLNESIIYVPENSIKLIGVLQERNQGFKRWIKAISTIRKSVKREKPEVLIGIMGLCTLFTYIACLGLHIPIIMTEHDPFERPNSAPFSFKEKLFKFVINRLYKHITVLTEADKKTIENRLKNVAVMPNPLLLTPLHERHPREKRILAAGRVDAWYTKGFDVLVKAWNQIYSKYPDWRLEIAGLCDIPAHYEEIPNLIKQYGIAERTKLLGYRTDVEQLYRDSEIFVLSSRYEGFGLVLIEAMSQGCAPIACDFKGRQREIIGETNQLETHPSPPCLGRVLNSTESIIINSSLNREDFQKDGIEISENGILCEPDNVEALAQALEKMMEDEEYRHKVQVNAIERSRFYDTEHTMVRWENYLNSIIK